MTAPSCNSGVHLDDLSKKPGPPHWDSKRRLVKLKPKLRDGTAAQFKEKERQREFTKLVNDHNRIICTGDNLDVMREMPDSYVDLIYLDPPFDSNRNYAAPIGSKAAGAAFKDTWYIDDAKLKAGMANWQRKRHHCMSL